MVNLEWYRTFIAIYQQGNMTRAAEELYISQPNVSIQLASLEAYVGQALFTRQPRQLVPTEAGKELYVQVVDAIERLEYVEATFRKSNLSTLKNYRIGSPIEYGTTTLLDKLQALDGQISFTFGLLHELIEALRQKDIDFAVATKSTLDTDIVYLPLVVEQFYLVASPLFDATLLASFIASNNLKALEQKLTEQNWVSYDQNLSIIRRFWKENFNKRPQLKPQWIIPDILGMRHAVIQGKGLSILSNLFFDPQQEELQVLWAGSQDTTNQLYLAYLREKEGSEELLALRSALGI